MVVPALVSGLQLGQEGGIFNLLDTVTNALERLDLAGQHKVSFVFWAQFIRNQNEERLFKKR